MNKVFLLSLSLSTVAIEILHQKIGAKKSKKYLGNETDNQ